MTEKWVELNDLSSNQYSVNKNIRFKTSMLSPDLYDYSDGHIALKVTGTEEVLMQLTK